MKITVRHKTVKWYFLLKALMKVLFFCLWDMNKEVLKVAFTCSVYKLYVYSTFFKNTVL